MSADSQRRSASSAVRCMPAVVPPQAVSDRSIIDSVAGFINDVALQQVPQGDAKDHILWARFESAADISDPCMGDDWELEGNVAPPLLLILGYGTGIQVWIIPANGEAIEVLSWKHGNVKCLRVLPTPAKGDGEMANELNDMYMHKRPLIALCDSSTSGPTGGQYCSINFVSLKDGDNVKSIKFKNPIVDILANRSSIVVTFPERIAVFDARTLEDRLTVTTCFLSPGINSNPVALGPRWIAYAEKKLLPSKRSSGGCDGESEKSYTATVLSAAKSLGKGLRELGEQMAAGLTGTSGASLTTTATVNINDGTQGGIVTVLDIKHPVKDISPTTGTPISVSGSDPIIAHFVAHSEAIVALSFDSSGMLLLTADKRGHDFHVFRIQPHPSGPSLAAVHHLYVLHRGDTTAKVQDIVFSLDSRWVAISTLRGTTHVFPVTPYGGPAGIRTHGSPNVVNRLSRFHRSAGLSIDGRSSSPVSYSSESYAAHTPSSAYANPRVPPFPHPTVVQPLAQLRQPASLGNQSGTQPPKNAHTARQRNSSSSSDDLAKPLRVCATFAKARSWLLDPPGTARDTPAHRIQRKPVDSLFIMAAHGALIQYDLDPKHASSKYSSYIPKEKICDDTQIELEVEAKAQWYLQRQDNISQLDIQPPLPVDNWLIRDRFLDDSDMHDTMRIGANDHRGSSSSISDHDDRWLAQVEIITHAGPHRRLWMGPQFMFKIYNTPSGSPLSSIDIESVEIGTGTARPARSNPMNMPHSSGVRPLVPVLIESGSCSSYEQSPRLMNEFKHENMDSEFSSLGPVESQLREDLADAMRESPLMPNRDTTGYAPTTTGLSSISSCSSAFSSTHSLNSEKPLMHQATRPTPMLTVQKVVNPLGTVTTITKSAENDITEMSESAKKECDLYLYENCDEALFRPVVTVHGSQKMDEEFDSLSNLIEEFSEENAASLMNAELIVPVIEEKNLQYFNKNYNRRKAEAASNENLAKFEELSSINKKSKKPKFSEHDVTEKIVENEEIVNIEFVESKIDEKPKAAPVENRKTDKINTKKENLGTNQKIEKKTWEKKAENKTKIDEVAVEKCKENVVKNNENSKNRKKVKSEEVYVKSEKIDIVEKFDEIPIEAKELLKCEISMKNEEIMQISDENVSQNIPKYAELSVETTEIVTEKNMKSKEKLTNNKKSKEEEYGELMKISVENVEEKLSDFVAISVENTENDTEKNMTLKSKKVEKSKKEKYDEKMEISVENVDDKIAEFVELPVNTEIVTEKYTTFKSKKVDKPKNEKYDELMKISVENVEEKMEEFVEMTVNAENVTEKNTTFRSKKVEKSKNYEKMKGTSAMSVEEKMVELADISVENTEYITEKNSIAKTSKNKKREDLKNMKETIAQLDEASNNEKSISKIKKKAKEDESFTKTFYTDFPEKPLENFEEIPMNSKELLKSEIVEKIRKNEKIENLENLEHEEFMEICTENLKENKTEFVEISRKNDIEKNITPTTKNTKNDTEKNVTATKCVEMPQDTTEKTTNNFKKESKNSRKYNKKNNRKSPDYEAEIIAEIGEIEKCDKKDPMSVKEPFIDEVKKDLDYEIDFPEPELPPLEPFCTKTMEEDISFDDCTGGAECEKTENDHKIENDDKISIIMEELKKKRAFDEKNFVFAMCSSLKEASCDDEEENMSTSGIKTVEKTLSIEDSDYKSLEMDMEENPPNEKNVSEEEDDSSSSNANTNIDDDKVPSSDDNQQEQEDDEELQPLIRRESFQTGDDSSAAEFPSQRTPLTPFDMNDDEFPSSSPSAMMNTLPDNSNQSDNNNKCVNIKQIINNNKKKSKKKRK